jgi:hypothetical protein
LEVVTAEDFKRFPKVKNKIEDIPRDLFKCVLTDLIQILLQENRIKHVGTKFFNYLNVQKLQVINMNKNPCINSKRAVKGDKHQMEFIRRVLLENCTSTMKMNKDDFF